MEQVVRVKYSKEGSIKYISHLNLVQVFTRAIRRANIPVLISSGFNPRFRISFGPPLALGISSSCEFFDIRLTKETSIKELIQDLNCVLPSGLKTIDARIITSSTDSLVKAIDQSTYLVTLQTNGQDKQIEGNITKSIEKFLDLKEIWIDKPGKKRIKKLNIRPAILEIKIEEMDIQNKKLVIKLTIKMGNDGNLNPNYVIKSWLLENRYMFEVMDLSRIGMYVANKEVMQNKKIL